MHFSEFMSLFFSRENGQNTKILEVRHENGRRRVLGAQSIDTERASYKQIRILVKRYV